MASAEIIAEIEAALAEVGAETGNGPVAVRLLRWDGSAETPHDAPAMISAFADNLVDGTNIKRDDLKVMVGASLAIEPRSGDKLQVVDGADIWSSQTYRVVSSKAVAPGGEVLYHLVQARGDNNG